ncbi:hypothetical protein COV19_05100 [Candidatus Woesearchaeota archaeon CG10_big_fil_rev_8_21_14_0_10_44_13]|nr:MAG: hypothetical protein COV19_05100 [Candidatus Woesearchaeota archaeon CG10_big_fil_rev_8_21_14_0_10_44_13]
MKLREKLKEIIPKINLENIIEDHDPYGSDKDGPCDAEDNIKDNTEGIEEKTNHGVLGFLGKHRIAIAIIALFFLKCSYGPVQAYIHTTKATKLHLQQRDYPHAEAEYKKAIGFDPQIHSAHNNLGLLYYEQGKLDLAEMEYKGEIALNPKCSMAYFNLGLLYIGLKDYKRAEQNLKISSSLNPDYAPAQSYLSNVYSLTGRTDDAGMQFSIAKKLEGGAKQR